MANKDNTYTVDNFVIELDTDDKEQSEREYIEFITATIMTICNDFISRHPNINLCSSQGLTELLKDIRRKYKADKDNIKELNILWDIYTVICCTCRIKPTLMRYCIMVDISRDTINSWLRGEYSGRVASGHSDTAQNWKQECESTLYDEVIQTGNIGCMFALKANYGYRDNIQIIQTDGKASLPAYSREEIAARAKATESLPGSVDDLPD
ncbi:hypothetical protein [Enterocloster clostridioformis]|uniref:hypothetical protein n=1 Tax=Enterocloster clostridioformis TaxID=1531 RepID=UPI0034A409F9